MKFQILHGIWDHIIWFYENVKGDFMVTSGKRVPEVARRTILQGWQAAERKGADIIRLGSRSSGKKPDGLGKKGAFRQIIGVI